MIIKTSPVIDTERKIARSDLNNNSSWAVVGAQSLLTPVVCGSNPVIGNFYLNFLSTELKR